MSDDKIEVMMGILSEYQEFVVTAMAEGHHVVYEDPNEFLRMMFNAFVVAKNSEDSI
jgi:hypothetical protein